MRKHCFSVLCSLWMLLVMQGCQTRAVKSHVIITLDNKPVTLHFETFKYIGRNAKPFIELLEKLERKEEVAINEPLSDPTVDGGVGNMPLEEATKYGLGELYRPTHGGDTDFYAARYLLAKGADPNTAIHELCSELRFHGAVGKRGLVLLLSYGARLDIQNKELPYRRIGTPSYTPLRSLEGNTPWIPQSLRKEYEKQAGSKEPLSEPPTAWETAMPPEEQQERKTKYFTDIAEQLLKPENNRGNRLHPSFVEYLEEKTQVGRELIERLKAISSS